MSEDKNNQQGYKGLAWQKMQEWQVRVWSDVRVENDIGSVFEGVILPRGESFDDLHVVLKMKNGYNVGIHVNRVKRHCGVGLQRSGLQDPRKGFPQR